LPGVDIAPVLVEHDESRPRGQRAPDALGFALHPRARVARGAARLGAHLAPLDARVARQASRVVVDRRTDPGRHPRADRDDADLHDQGVAEEVLRLRAVGFLAVPSEAGAGAAGLLRAAVLRP